MVASDFVRAVRDQLLSIALHERRRWDIYDLYGWWASIRYARKLPDYEHSLDRCTLGDIQRICADLVGKHASR